MPEPSEEASATEDLPAPWNLEFDWDDDTDCVNVDRVDQLEPGVRAWVQAAITGCTGTPGAYDVLENLKKLERDLPSDTDDDAREALTYALDEVERHTTGGCMCNEYTHEWFTETCTEELTKLAGVWSLHDRNDEPIEDHDEPLDFQTLRNALPDDWSSIAISWDGARVAVSTSGRRGAATLTAYRLTAEQVESAKLFDSLGCELPNAAARTVCSDVADFVEHLVTEVPDLEDREYIDDVLSAVQKQWPLTEEEQQVACLLGQDWDHGTEQLLTAARGVTLAAA